MPRSGVQNLSSYRKVNPTAHLPMYVCLLCLDAYSYFAPTKPASQTCENLIIEVAQREYAQASDVHTSEVSNRIFNKEKQQVRKLYLFENYSSIVRVLGPIVRVLLKSLKHIWKLL